MRGNRCTVYIPLLGRPAGVEARGTCDHRSSPQNNARSDQAECVTFSDEAEGLLAVEMEAVALYTFARAKENPVNCFAHITNQMGNVEGDFEKGEGDSSTDALEEISLTVSAWMTERR